MFVDLKQFVRTHCRRSDLTSDVTEAFESGYQVVIECACGAKLPTTGRRAAARNTPADEAVRARRALHDLEGRATLDTRIGRAVAQRLA